MKSIRIFLLVVLCAFACLPQLRADLPANTETDSPVDVPTADILTYYEASDSMEGFNRTMFSFNSGLAEYFLIPMAKFYSFLVPDYGRKRIALFAYNLNIPGRLINCMLQGRWTRAGIELSRFGINTTAGVAGLWDVADPWCGMLPQVNGFGMTFQHWGISSGSYLVVPIEASTTVRDGVGMLCDLAADPLTWLPFSSPLIVLLRLNDMTSVVDDYEVIKASNKDPYMMFKSLYFVKRVISMQELNSNGMRTEDLDTQRNEDVEKI